MKRFKFDILELLKVVFIVALGVFVISVVMVTARNESYETAQVFSKIGSRGEEVRLIQQKLKSLGLYYGAVDGIFGKQTDAAVRSFQRKNGLTADGVAGARTLKAMGIDNKGESAGITGSNDYQLLAKIINAEAKGESYEGQVAVGAVVLNRVRHPSFPSTIGGVIYQQGAFGSVNNGQLDKPVKDSCYNAARDALNGWDPSGGAVYFYNADKTVSNSLKSRPVVKQIGTYTFAK